MKAKLISEKNSKNGPVREEKDVDVLFFKKNYYYGKGEFVVMNKSFAKLISSKLSDKLTGFDFRVLMALVSKAEANNRIRRFKQKSLADELGSSQPKVSRSLQRLISFGIIEEKGEDWPELFFNKQYIYTGGIDGAVEELTDYDD